MIWRLPAANAGSLTAARSVAARSVAVRAIVAGCLIAGSAAAVPGVLPASTALAGAAAAASAGTPLYAFNSGLALTVSVRPRPGAWVRVEPYRGSAGQRWVVGKYQTLRPAADQNLCLNVPGGRYRGAKLQLQTCGRLASERFATSAPSAHTTVEFVRPVARARFCLTSLGDQPPAAGERVGLVGCYDLITQAWSATNLADLAGVIGNAWNMQALQPTKAGSAITGASVGTLNLNQSWISSYTGGAETSPVLLHPVTDTALCAALASPEADRARLILSRCHGRASGQFMTIPLIIDSAYTFSFITTTDGAFCVQPKPSGRAATRPIILGRCVGNNRDFWYVGTDMLTPTSEQYQEFYAGANSLQYSMRVVGSGGPGSPVVLSNDNQAAAQVWTDMVPGAAKPTANPDGSISLRPLSNESLCLAVPGGDYSAGVRLTVQTCDGHVDQEFVRALEFAPTDLVAAGDGRFCVTAAGGIGAGSAIELQPCAQQADQTWSAFFAWYGWAGQPLTATSSAAYPDDALILSGATATGGQVAVAASPGPAAWATSQDWLQVAPSGGGIEIQSFYDRSLCLDAPADTAGTQLTAAPCVAGSTAQTFLHGVAASNLLWELQATARTTKMCVAVGAVSGSAGLPLELEPCSASQANEAWFGPMYQL